MTPERQRALQASIAEMADELGAPGTVFVALFHEDDCRAPADPAHGLDVCECASLRVEIRLRRGDLDLHQVWREGDEGPEPLA